MLSLQLISVRVALQQEQTRSERAERALEITLRQLNASALCIELRGITVLDN